MAGARESAFHAHHAGRLDEAERAYRDLLAADALDAQVRHALAVVLMQRGREGEALEHLQTLAASAAPPAGTALLLAMAYRALGRLIEGLSAIEPAIAANPGDAAAWTLAGSLRVMSGDFSGGEAALRRALQLDPRNLDATSHLAIALHRQQRWAAAIELYRRVRDATPYDANVRYNLALSLEALGDLEAARVELERVVRLRPARLDARLRLANLQALLCDFDGEAASVAAAETLLAAPEKLADDDHGEPFVLTFLPLSRQAAETALRRYVARVRREAASMGGAIARPARDAQPGVLRLGYVSPDFGDHAVGGLVRDLFAAHDRSRVQVHGYSLRRQQGAVADAIRAGFDAFASVENESTRAIAERIAADGIDVLIDLGGYTLAARPALFALRPAPVQLGYLGFIHDYGAEWIDRVLLDAHVAPSNIDAGFVNAILRLDGCLLPAAQRSTFVAASRESFGLPASGPLLASFNNSYKLDAELLDAWAGISRRLPDAHFVVYVPEAARAGLQHQWRRRGLADKALILVPKLEPARHLARAAVCDLLLDAFRYQAGATAVSALEAGLPVLCREGDSPLARLGVSVNRWLGLDELVAPDTAAYVERAVQLAGDLRSLGAVRLRQAQAVEAQRFFDPRRSAAAIERAAATAWAEILAVKPAP